MVHSIRYFIEARMLASLFPVIEAYTTTLKFDEILNHHCIETLRDLLRVTANPTNTLAASVFYLIASVNFDPMLRPRYAFVGRVYRGLKMSTDYIRTFKKNELVVNQPFVSTSRNIKVANIFAGWDQTNRFRRTQSNNYLQSAVRLTYLIRSFETQAIDITDMSRSSTTEEEVLLMPISAFRVIDIRSDANAARFDITLEDCELPSKNDPLAPVIRCDFAEFPKLPLIVPIVQVRKNPSTSFIISFALLIAEQ